MAQIQDSSKLKQKTPPPRPERPGGVSFFLGCFGRSSGGVLETHQAFHKGDSDSKKRSEIPWFSLSRLRARKSLRRNVSIDSSANEKSQDKKRSLQMTKSSKKSSFSSSHQLLPTKAFDKTLIPAPVAAEKICHEKPNKTRQNIILGNSKSASHIESISNNTSKSSISRTNSPEVMFEVALSHPLSVLPPRRNISVNNRGRDPPVMEEEKSLVRNDGKFDQFVGMSIVLGTLLIMTVWGKLCAILCTSAWFYCYPLIRSKKVPNVTQEKASRSGQEIDLDSKEHKKKLVLEGLLERNHQKN